MTITAPDVADTRINPDSIAIAGGYLHPDYAASLQEFGMPTELPRCGGWVLKRQIPGFLYFDAMGAYPLFSCRDWSKLQADLEEQEDDLVSLSLVTDPFGNYDPAYLQQCFKDVFIPFKQHYVVDLQLPLHEIGGKRRRKHARRALKEVSIEVIEEPAHFVEEWVKTYNVLIQKHAIAGIRAFSKQSFLKQLSLPGTVALRAEYQGETVGAQIYFIQDEVVHVHLGACTEKGYELEATYALDWYSIEYFQGKARWLNLGGGAGLSADGTDGLSQYKNGWATGTRMTYFCGRILNQAKYIEMVRAKGISTTHYFPAYRQGEFS